METARLPKFEWGRIDEQNAGHTKEEWGEIEDTPDTPNIIEMYEMKWSRDEKDSVSTLENDSFS